jgi:hypothetical protein
MAKAITKLTVKMPSGFCWSGLPLAPPATAKAVFVGLADAEEESGFMLPLSDTKDRALLEPDCC